MSGRLVVSALVLVVLAVPPGAVAKGVQDAQVCGAEGCQSAPLNADTYIVFETMGGTVPAPTARAPFYELRYKTMHGQGADIHELTAVRALFVPSAGVRREEDGTWTRVDARAAEAMRRHLTGVAPFPAAKLDLPGVPAERAARPAAAADGPPALLLVALALVGTGGALAAGSRRRRRPAAG